MTTRFYLPQIGENISSAQVTRILVSVGQNVQKEASILELEAEKAIFEIPSPYNGVIKEIQVKEGEKVSPGSLLVVFENGEESNETKEQNSEKNLLDIKKESQSSIQVLNQNIPIFLTPALRRKSHQEKTGSPQALLSPHTEQRPKEKESSLSGVRLIIAEKLTRSWSEIPQVTQFEEADVTELKKIGEELKKIKESKISLTVLMLKLIAIELKKFPIFNSYLLLKEKKIFERNGVSIGVAVATEEGLFLPVVSEVDQKTVFEIAQELQRKIVLAKDKKLKPEEMQGASFAITNLGMIGGTHFTPLVPPLHSAILGIGRTSISPVWKTDHFEPKKTVPLSLSYDHRLVDGADAARFIQSLKESIENPNPTFKDLK